MKKSKYLKQRAKNGNRLEKLLLIIFGILIRRIIMYKENIYGS